MVRGASYAPPFHAVNSAGPPQVGKEVLEEALPRVARCLRSLGRDLAS
jgi:hypothetical protein